MRTLLIPDNCNKDDILLGLYARATFCKDKGFPCVAKSVYSLIDFIEANNPYTAEELELFAKAED